MIQAIICELVLMSGAGISFSGPIMDMISVTYLLVSLSISDEENFLGSQTMRDLLGYLRIV